MHILDNWISVNFTFTVFGNFPLLFLTQNLCASSAKITMKPVDHSIRIIEDVMCFILAFSDQSK